MFAVKEEIECPNCGNIFLEREENQFHCFICTRDMDKNGQLIQHPIGADYNERQGTRFTLKKNRS